MKQGYHFGYNLKPLIHVPTLFSAGTHFPPTQHNYITFGVDREIYSHMVQISKLFVAFFLSAVTIPLVVALPVPGNSGNPKQSVFILHD